MYTKPDFLHVTREMDKGNCLSATPKTDSPLPICKSHARHYPLLHKKRQSSHSLVSSIQTGSKQQQMLLEIAPGQANKAWHSELQVGVDQTQYGTGSISCRLVCYPPLHLPVSVASLLLRCCCSNVSP